MRRMTSQSSWSEWRWRNTSRAEKLKECLSPIEEKRGRAAVGVDGSDSDIGSGAHKWIQIAAVPRYAIIWHCQHKAYHNPISSPCFVGWTRIQFSYRSMSPMPTNSCRQRRPPIDSLLRAHHRTWDSSENLAHSRACQGWYNAISHISCSSHVKLSPISNESVG